MFNRNKRKVQFNTEKQTHLNASKQEVSKNLDENIAYLKGMYHQSTDIVFRNFSIGGDQEVRALLLGVDGLYEKEVARAYVLKPLMELKLDEGTIITKQRISELLNVVSLQEETSMSKAIEYLMHGDIMLFVDGLDCVFVIGGRAWEMRNIQEPATETTVRGPRESFVETLQTNTSMIRRKIHHPNLKSQSMTLGKYSQTSIAIIYIEGIVSPSILEELNSRLQKINVDNIAGGGYIEEFIEDRPYSIFPDIAYTERPDVAAAKLLEGRVVIVIEGSPIVLTIPHLLMETFQSPEDYYSRPYYASLIRILRFIGFMISTLLPAVFVAAQNFHKEMFPTDFLISVAAARVGVPFPLFIEVLVMVIAFEFLKETGIRMPTSVGQAIAIVGGLVIGQAAVEAGIVGTVTVIVIAITSITTFMVPMLNDTTGLLRIIYLLAAGLLGMYGIMLVISFFLLHVASMRSFGIPYTAPFFPITWSGWKDLFVRFPLWSMNKRPQFLHIDNNTRQGEEQKPASPDLSEGSESP